MDNSNKKEKYSSNTYLGFMVSGRLHEAVEYLEGFSGKRRKAEKIRARMESEAPVKRCRNPFVSQVDAVYQKYYKAVFWRNETKEQAEEKLLADFSSLLKREDLTSVDQAEKAAEKAVKAEDFQFLGGTTGGHYGAYIWRKTKDKHYRVKLPHHERDFVVKMMYGFISRSWVDFITLGRLGTGGWAKEDGLYCVRKSYVGRIYTQSYRVVFLKHEAQHALDYELFEGRLQEDELEYRAKLVELIYYRGFSRLAFFLGEAASFAGDGTNSHPAAAHRLIRELSQRLFGEDDVYDINRWKGKEKEIKAECIKLYDSFVPRNEAV